MVLPLVVLLHGGTSCHHLDVVRRRGTDHACAIHRTPGRTNVITVSLQPPSELSKLPSTQERHFDRPILKPLRDDVVRLDHSTHPENLRRLFFPHQRSSSCFFLLLNATTHHRIQSVRTPTTVMHARGPFRLGVLLYLNSPRPESQYKVTPFHKTIILRRARRGPSVQPPPFSLAHLTPKYWSEEGMRVLISFTDKRTETHPLRAAARSASHRGRASPRSQCPPQSPRHVRWSVR